MTTAELPEIFSLLAAKNHRCLKRNERVGKNVKWSGKTALTHSTLAQSRGLVYEMLPTIGPWPIHLKIWVVWAWVWWRHAHFPYIRGPMSSEICLSGLGCRAIPVLISGTLCADSPAGNISPKKAQNCELRTLQRKKKMVNRCLQTANETGSIVAKLCS